MSVERLSAEEKEYLSSFGLSEEIQKQAILIHYEKGDYLCREGDSMPYLLFLISGKAKVSVAANSGRTLLLSFYTPGGILGDVELMTDGIGASNVIAITPAACIGIPLSYCQEALKNNANFMRFIGTSLAGKLKQCSKNSAANLLNTLDARLCAYIDMTSENGRFTENLTETAELLGTSYRHLLRTLHKLCKSGVLERLSRTQYLISDINALKEICQEQIIFERFNLLD